MIESYSFGKMVIDGKAYTSDLIIYPEKIDGDWWREESHVLKKSDVDEIVAYNPDVLIVGTGAYGRMDVPQETVEYIQSKGIQVLIGTTKEMMQRYNEMPNKENVVAAFHLTC
jgi:hypothetical protein